MNSKMEYIIKVKPNSNSSQTIYWNKDGNGFVHKESDLTPVDSEYIEWFKSSAYYDGKNTTIDKQ